MNVNCPTILALAISISSAGCRSTTTVCSARSKDAIRLTVVDSLSSSAPTSPSTVVATNGSYTETVTSTDAANNVYSIGDARSGTFSLVVKTLGYADWSMSGVEVTADECGLPYTVRLTARLQH